MKILLIDDHKMFLEGMGFILDSIDPSIETLVASSLADGLRALDQQPDLVITDLELPDTNGIGSLHAIRATAPNLPVVVLAGSEDARMVRQVIDRGGSGYIFKSADSVELAKALRIILAGGVYLPAVALSSEKYSLTAAPELTERKKEVLRRLVRGLSNKEIARELFISVETVKTHVRELFDILGVHTRTRAVYTVAMLGLELD